MKLPLLTSVVILTTTSFVAPVSAQNPQPVKPPQVSGEQVLQACAQDKADTLPIPFSDISPTDWAFKAVMSMYYCGAYRGSIPPEQVKPFLQPQSAPSSERLS